MGLPDTKMRTKCLQLLELPRIAEEALALFGLGNRIPGDGSTINVMPVFISLSYRRRQAAASCPDTGATDAMMVDLAG